MEDPQSEKKEQGITVEELFRELEDLRSNGSDIYQIARHLQMLIGRGAEAALTDKEKVDLKNAFILARNNSSDRVIGTVLPGYEIARFLMLGKFFGIDEIVFNEADVKLIEEAMHTYEDEKNYSQLDSLKRTLEYIGLKLD